MKSIKIDISKIKLLKDNELFKNNIKAGNLYKDLVRQYLGNKLNTISDLIKNELLVRIKLENIINISKDEIKSFLLGFSFLIGKPTKTNKMNNSILWSVTPKNSKNEYKTFSEIDGEAKLHTDTQFYPKPEKSLILYCEKPANKGGLSYIVKLEDIIKYLDGYKNKENIINFLKNTKIPFMVPTIFTKTCNNDSIEIFKSPILYKNNLKIRYRYDSIKKAIDLIPTLLSESEKEILEEFNYILENKIKKFFIKLNSGELLIINNNKLLHGRTYFSDNERLLYRIRFN